MVFVAASKSEKLKFSAWNLYRDKVSQVYEAITKLNKQSGAHVLKISACLVYAISKRYIIRIILISDTIWKTGLEKDASLFGVDNKSISLQW